MGSSTPHTKTRSFGLGQIGPAATAALLALLIVLAPHGGPVASADHGPPLIWGAAKPMPTARAGLGLAALGGKLYAVGGHAGSTYYNTLEIYNPATDSWSTGPSMPTARAYAGAAVADGKLYVAGGEDRSGLLKTVEVYDPAANAWSPFSPMLNARFRLGLFAWGSYLAAIGGLSLGATAPTIEVFETFSNSWLAAEIVTATGSPVTIARRLDFGVAPLRTLDQGGVALVGGFTNDLRNANGTLDLILMPAVTLEDERPTAYMVVVGPDLQGQPFPTARASMGVASLYGRDSYVLGGTRTGADSLATVERLTKAHANSFQVIWQPQTSLPTARRGLAAAAVGDAIYAVGGADASGTALNTVERGTFADDSRGLVEQVEDSFATGGTLTTDPAGDGATATDPIETTVTSTTGGAFGIREGPTTRMAPPGVRFLNAQVAVAGQSSIGPQIPLKVTFQVNASLLPPGASETTLQVLHDGTTVGACEDPTGFARPDPCVAERARAENGAVLLAVLTSRGGDWNFGLPLDIVAPTTTATITPAPNAAGWQRGAVQVELSAADNPGGSGVKQIRYSVSGAVNFGNRVSGASARFAFEVGGGGGVVTLDFGAEDVDGNVEANQSRTIRIDDTAPTASITAPADGATYLRNQVVTAAYTCADQPGLSGVASCAGPVANGAAVDTATIGPKSFAVKAADVAGNEASRTVAYNVENPKPVAASITPNAAKKGSGDLALVVTGRGFVPESVVRWNGSDLVTTAVSATELKATVPATRLTADDVGYVTVSSPAPGGGTSDPLAVFISDTGAAVTSAATGSSTSATGTATATAGGTGGVSATAAGSGTVSVAVYATNPGGTPSFNASGGYVDVFVAPNSNFTSLTIKDCALNGGNLVYWWDGTTWVAASDQVYDPATKCVTVTVTSSTRPTLAQLVGSYLGASRLTYEELCALTTQALRADARSRVTGLCATLEKAKVAERLDDPAVKTRLIVEYKAAIDAAVRAGLMSPTDGAMLKRLADLL